jgi:hypothetical protein
VNPYVEMDYITDLKSVLETRRANLGTRVSFANGSAVEVQLQDQFERLRDPFGVFPGVTIPAGDYPFRSASVLYESNQSRALTGSLRLSGGDFYDGTRKTAAFSARWRPRPDLFVAASAERNDVDLPGGSFKADLVGLQTRYAFSTRFLTSAFVQYNAEASQLVTNVRLDFRHAPLSDVFLVYTERRDTERALRLERSLALKVTRLLAF